MNEKSDHDLCAKDANIGDATRSPTMNADDITPSSKLVKSKSPLHVIYSIKLKQFNYKDIV